MKKKSKKLLVSVEKVRELQAAKLGGAAGGTDADAYYGASVCGCHGTIATCKTTKIICSPSEAS